MQPSRSSNRIKLNRNSFRLESGSVPKRRRTVGEPRDPLPGADPALAGCGHRASPTPGTREPGSELPGDGNLISPSSNDRVCANEGGPGPSCCGIINDTNGNDRVSKKTEQPRPISCHLRFALRLSDEKDATRKPSTEPSTVECYINGKVCVDSSVRFGSAEPTGLSTPSGELLVAPSRHGRGRPRCTHSPETLSSGVKPALETQVKPPWTQASKAEAPNFNKKTKGKKRFGLVTRFGSGGHVKRSVKNSCCALCGDVKYTAPAHKKRAEIRKPRLRFPGLPRRREGNKVHPAAAQAKQKSTFIIWPRVYPRVNLCDIARVFDLTARDFSCILPMVLHQERDKKSVQCLKKELRSLIHLYRNDDGKWIGCQISKVCAPTNRCLSLSSGERDSGTTGDQCSSDIAVGHVDDCPETSDKHVARILDHEMMRLTSVERTPCLPTSCGSVRDCDETDDNCAKELPVSSDCHEDTLAPVPKEPPLVVKCVASCNGIGSPQSYQSKSSSDYKSPVIGEPEARHSVLEENGMSEDSDGEVYSPHSFSCQRTQAYLTWPRLSCARTYRSWPFPRRGPPAEMKSAVCTGPRWITTLKALHSREHEAINVQTSLQPRMIHNCTTGKNVMDDLVRILGSSNVNLLAQKKQDQTPFTKLNKMMTDPTETFGDPKEHQNERGPFRILVSSNEGLESQKEQGKTPSTKLNKVETDPMEVLRTPTEPAEHQNKTGSAVQSDYSMVDNSTIGKNVRYGPVRILGSSNQCIAAHKEQGKSLSPKLNEMDTAPKEVQDFSGQPTEHQKNNGKADKSDHSIKDDCAIRKNVRDGLFKILGSSNKCLVIPKGPKVHQKESGNSKLPCRSPSRTELVPHTPNKPSCFHPGEKKEAEENCSPHIKADLWSTESCHSPANMSDDLDTVKSVEYRSPSNVEPKILPLDKSLEGSEVATETTASKAPEHFKETGLNKGVQGVMLHAREDSCTSSSSSLKMVCSSEGPQASPLLTLPIGEQGSVASVENMADSLFVKNTSNPVVSPLNSYSKQNEDCSSSQSSSSSSSDEHEFTSKLSHADGSEDSEVDAESSSLRDELSESNRTSPDSPPLCSPESSMVAGDDLDVLRAYEEDAIILDVIQDDPDLFGVVELTESLLQTRCPVASKKGNTMTLAPEKPTSIRNRSRIVWSELESPRKLTSADCKMESLRGFHTVDISESSQDSMTQHNRSWFPMNAMLKPEQFFTDCNNNLEERYVETNAGKMLNSTGSSRLVIDASSNVRSTAGTGISAPRSSPVQYCYYYFSEHHVCTYVVCRYLHSAKAEDEKFCMDTVLKFCRAGDPLILQRAVAVFVEYYRTNSPGASYNQSVVNSLLACLLNLALIRDLLSVINTLLTHKKTPPPDLMMALYEHVRERGLLGTVPELILLTSRILEAGCVFTVNQCEMMQSQLQMLQVPRQQMEIFQAVKCRALATNPQTAEVSVLAEVVVQVEMCKQQENWSELARVFCNVCNGHYSAGEVTRFCCCVTIALITESKDKLTLPFEPFAEAICQKEPPDALVRSFLGRVGISLMFKYYRILDWAKGMKVVLVMSRLHVEFSILKGLFSSEEGMSRCKLVTTATELFLNSGSIEGALNVLRADKWFVSSSTWPCEAGDVESRKRVLTQLAGKTSHRDTLEVLSNLPGLSKQLDGVQVAEYCSVFNTHLRKCVMNQVLPVAADTLEFMLTQGIAPDALQLQNVIHKLGKQNIWSRARVLFKRARSAGYYSEVECLNDSLALPCSLNEIEMTLAFEMFITGVGATIHDVNDPSQPLLITLKRTAGGKTVLESVYLAAGCCMLSAAQIPNPKLSIRYMAVNQDQEQIFHLDRGSAAKWLSHNHTWAQEMWAS